MTRPDTTARVRRDDGTTFDSAVIAACVLYDWRATGWPTHCAVNPNEPDRVATVGSVAIVTAEDVPVGQMWAYREI